MRDLARWLYRQLELEYNYLTSDEAVDETIGANGLDVHRGRLPLRLIASAPLYLCPAAPSRS